MSRADAQRPAGQGTEPTGHLTLTKNQFPIDHTVYFRDVFFGGQAWNREAKNREAASVSIDVIVRGVTLGVLNLRVDHNPAFVADQGNRATTLRWGADLNRYLREHDLVGDNVTIEKLGDGSYRLIIDSKPTGTFLE